MGGFFLHRFTWAAIADRYGNLFKAEEKTKAAARKSGILNFGVRGMIYEVSITGAVGTVKEVEKLNIWEFFDFLSYIRAQNEFRAEAIK